MPALLLTLRPGQAWAQGRATSVRWTLHDTADGLLADQGLVLIEAPGGWRLERLHAGLPGQVPPVLSHARQRAALAWPDAAAAVQPDVAPVREVVGRRRMAQVDGVAVEALETAHGTWLRLEGPAEALVAAVSRLDGRAAAAARGPAAAALDLWPAPVATRIRPEQTVAEALAAIVAGQLAAMLHWAARLGAPGTDPVPVHQFRVATRRLRSALAVFRHRQAPIPLAPPRDALKQAAGSAGAARDWDVFLPGTGAHLAAALPDEPRCAALLRAGARRRDEAYAALQTYLAGPEFGGLTVQLALLAVPGEHEPGSLPDFAAAALERAHRRVRKAGRGLDDLPVAALHELRKDCKRLRYTAEFMAPLFPGRAAARFMKRLAALQEELGALNDGAAAAALIRQLGPAQRGFGLGLVEGYAAAQGGGARAAIAHRWKRFKAAEPFWHG